MKYQTYTKYKKISFSWYKQIPAGWYIMKIKHVARTVNGGTPITSNESYWEGNIPWLPSGMIHNNTINKNDVCQSLEILYRFGRPAKENLLIKNLVNLSGA